MSIEVRVPTLGESVTEATVATWFKKPGDSVAADEMLCELETDKVTVEVPAPSAGVLGEIVAGEGVTVGVDALLATIGEGAGAASAPAAAAPAQAASSDTAASVDVMVPSLGESVSEATVASWFKQVGDTVAADEMLCELETDKVSVEVPAPAAGVLTEILAPEGSTVDATAKLAVIGGAGAVAAPAAPAAAQNPAAAVASGKDVEDAPSAKVMMAQAGLAAGSVQGTGRDGRVMKHDVQAAMAAPKAAAAPAPAAVPAAAKAPVDNAAREERVKMTRLRQTIARRLKDSQNTAAMLTTYNEVDMTEVMALRNEYKAEFEKKHGVRLGFMSFFTKACCHALKEVPEVNAEIDGTDIVYKNYVNMGVAAGTPTGLVVPVINDADAMSFAAIEKAIAEKGRRARDGKLSMEEMQGGTFTISNGGVYGSLMSSPILNPPQSGILGMHKIQDRPMAINGQVVIRPMMYLALSYDHRIVDGKGAVTFLVRVKEALEDPRRLLMDL
ncbi:2-oxoglutarate dehydrogenase complex dihydrolipoyllysine-residue succinyltransferase [Aliiroseovarius crassostreae]|uniref:Dihydrolipoyllysine-residue succinyltransferase component of 2-oxoglutarate dehydrogenase complex n=1 Tax=Aliiroseovarius crassostreae TaxID=154981 RepID=A0A9Q9HES6_9RHOB|nr:2-oxoglutarate dehydrogenase complex dihydrolipoyllysine-residue succinyltransferase [Aliiroseovarius crassostreae]UWP89651.1 2-oxoglutarate dehydrogenase complex dihydrolipoyllysine-residue succinyltransferase [Aliiroseovarius crassostreae]UWP95932.1 2-oxoglutarate dehydrogenase complex dihydrolipoyllysine-residue succinyltransferase [Aliiroseovarius crassostreae]UWQ02300.1 2-oxoglutarate dehydrogenase complex dihydrolipoyllysine-residue succinyltransferase [Aliiroseovarius crassostreae]